MVSVLVGMNHELDSTSHIVVMAFIDSAEDISDYRIKVISNVKDCLDQAMLHSWIFDVYLYGLVEEHGLVAVLNNYGIHYLLD